MRAVAICLSALAALVGSPAVAQTADRGARNFIETRTFSAADDQRILKAFEGLRVADVTDGMDFVGLHNVGLMDPEIHSLWKDPAKFTHRFIGIAVTVRYVPTQRQAAGGGRTYEDFRAWEGSWYHNLSSEPFVPLIRPGTAIVIDDAPNADVGSIGSNNIMGWKLAGAVGVVTDATGRDIRPGRNEVESVNRPVVVGGVLVKPGDVIVADGDGVVVVPRDVALKVAEFAHKIMESDKAGRRELYKKLGLPEDPSVR